MKKKLKLKSFVIPTFVTIIMVITLVVTITVPKKDNLDKTTNLNYVSNTILGNELAVMNEKTKIINPYLDSSVTIGKNYYDYKETAENQEKSIVYYDGTYMQNSGIDFVSDSVFDVVSILNGTVINVKEDEALGKIVEVKHDNNYISIYQSLSEVSVKKDETISQGQPIGKSGTNKLDKELGNHLHFEFYTNGQIVDPNLYLNKEIAHKKNKE